MKQNNELLPNCVQYAKAMEEVEENWRRKISNTIYMDCPVCCKRHEIEELEEWAELTVHNKHITYKERYYHCNNTDQDFLTGYLLDDNLKNAREALEEDENGTENN